MNTMRERLQELEEDGSLPVSAAKLELEALCTIADALNRISANTRTQWPISTTCEVIPLNNDNEDNQ